MPLQYRCPESGRVLSLWSCKTTTPEHPSKPTFPETRTIPISRISDDGIEAGGRLDRSGLRSSSGVLVNQATQEVTTSDRVVDA